MSRKQEAIKSSARDRLLAIKARIDDQKAKELERVNQLREKLKDISEYMLEIVDDLELIYDVSDGEYSNYIYYPNKVFWIISYNGDIQVDGRDIVRRGTYQGMSDGLILSLAETIEKFNKRSFEKAFDKYLTEVADKYDIPENAL